MKEAPEPKEPSRYKVLRDLAIERQPKEGNSGVFKKEFVPVVSSGPAPVDPSVDYFKSLEEGSKFGNDLFKEGSLGRLTDPNAAATADLLARQRAMLGGMDEATQNAARENALMQINSQANQQLSQIQNSAAGRGLRGGVVAAAQQPVLGQAADAYSSALRNLVSSVAQSQQDAANTYNTSLNNAIDLDTNIQTANNQNADAEYQGRLSVPFDYAAANSGYVAGDAAAELARKAAAIDTNPVSSTKVSTNPNAPINGVNQYNLAPGTPGVVKSTTTTKTTTGSKTPTRTPIAPNRREN